MESSHLYIYTLNLLHKCGAHVQALRKIKTKSWLSSKIEKIEFESTLLLCRRWMAFGVNAINPLTPKILLFFLPFSCYTLPYELVTGIWC